MAYYKVKYKTGAIKHLLVSNSSEVGMYQINVDPHEMCNRFNANTLY
jgi:hypothetical protein